MGENVFKEYVKGKLPRDDDKQLFEDLYGIYRKDGKEQLAKHLKELIAKLEE